MEALCESLLSATLLAYLAGAALGLLFCRRERLANFLSFGAALVGAGLGFACAIIALFAGPVARPFQLVPSLIPYLSWTVRLDALGAFFLLIVSSLGLCLSLYSFGYVRSFYGHKPVGILACFYNCLLLATTLVFTAGNSFFFLIAWEVMALAAYCLVSFEHEQSETRRAGVLFFVMSHIGTGCLILAFLLLINAAGTDSFAAFHFLGNRMPAGMRSAAFILFLVGFGVKAGMIPVHIWLPAAHPVAPSNISALMSGVLIKTGIYGLTRVLFDFLGGPPMWWGVTVLTLGTVSALLGVLYALMEHDLKRLLAYHSIENIGIILMGLGASLMFLHIGHPALAGVALLAGLYHTMNHALFKALLFMGAGAVLQSTRTRNMEELGGLIKGMPRTAFLFLAGAVAISALPPLNGFVSEWLTYQSLLQGFTSTEDMLRLSFPIAGAVLALTGALAAACFVKAFGVTFLGQARTSAAREAREVGASMILGQSLLAAACAGLGFFPIAFIRVLDPVTRELTGEAMSARLSLGSGLVLGAGRPFGGTVSPLGLAATALVLASIPWLLRWVFSSQTRVRIAPTWDCGLRGLTPQMQYSATGFSKPIRMIFKALFRPKREVQREYDYSPYFARTIRFASHVEEVFERRIYRPSHRLVLCLSRRMRALQAGSIQAYLIYIFVTLLALLFLAI